MVVTHYIAIREIGTSILPLVSFPNQLEIFMSQEF